MDRDLKRKWVNALRDDYTQARQQLRTVDYNGDIVGYCCLGVLCDLINPDGWYADGDEGEIYHVLGNENELSAEALDQLGITTAQMSALARLNDHGAPFEAIADILDVSALFRTEGERAV